MMKMRVKSVDHYGFNGREHHPSDSDIGLVVVPIQMFVDYYDASGGGCQLIGWDRDDPNRLACQPEFLFGDGDEKTGESVMACYRCVTQDGRFLDLMEFEVEVLR